VGTRQQELKREGKALWQRTDVPQKEEWDRTQIPEGTDKKTGESREQISRGTLGSLYIIKERKHVTKLQIRAKAHSFKKERVSITLRGFKGGKWEKQRSPCKKDYWGAKESMGKGEGESGTRGQNARPQGGGGEVY